MPVITFHSDRLPAPLSVAAECGELLLDVVRRAGLPLWWRCGQGTCGACRVTLSHPAQPRTIVMRRKERNVMIRQGFLPGSAISSDEFPDTPDANRLACHVVVESDLDVYF